METFHPTRSGAMGRRGRRTPLAWRMIVHHKVTMLVSTAAMAFAVLIMFMELGFLNGLSDSQTAALQFFRADLMMVSRGLHIFNTHDSFPRARLEQAMACRGVKGAYPVYVEDRLSELRHPATGVRHQVRAIGFDPGAPIFLSPEVERLADRLRTPMTIIFDRKSRSFLGLFPAATTTEIGNRAVTVAGTFELGPDYYYDGNLLTSADTLFQIFPDQQRTRVFLGLIQLEAEASPDLVLRDLRAVVGRDVDVMKKSDLVAREKATWRKTTPAGYVFTMGVGVGFVIGVFICYQILYTEISDQLPQLATMKALGYQHRDLVRLVLTQALLLGVLGFVPATAMTILLYGTLTTVTGIVTKLTVMRATFVFVLTLGMCFVAGLLAVRKALAADPADLF